MSDHQVLSSQEKQLPVPGAKIRKFRQCAPHPEPTQAAHQSEMPGVAGWSLPNKTPYAHAAMLWQNLFSW